MMVLSLDVGVGLPSSQRLRVAIRDERQCKKDISVRAS